MTKWITAMMAGVAQLPIAAYAQTAPSSETGDSPAPSADIIVTAQRYEQRLQDVPLSISVIGSEELAARAQTDLKDLQYSVPGFSTFQYGIGRQFLQMRGISNTIGSTTIGLYLDETPVSSDLQGDAFSIRLLDMDRIEVLRGPQATLYGQGSMGGTIRYIPAAPNLVTTSGSVEGEYSSTEGGGANYKAVSVLNLPLSLDKAGLRLVGGYERVGGFIDSAVTGEKNINSADIYTFRGSLLLKPTERLSLSLIGLYQKSQQDNQDYGVDRKTSAMIDTPVKDHYTFIQGKTAYDLDFAELSASGSYIDRRNTAVTDVSPFFAPSLVDVLGLPVGFIDSIGLTSVTDYEIYNGEVRLSSHRSGRLRWQIGAAYRDARTDQIAGDSTAPGTLPFRLIQGDVDLHTKSFTLYGEANYAVTSKLNVIAGLRYFSERRQQFSTSANFGVVAIDDNRDTFNTFNPRVNLSYAFTPNSMLYVNVAKGFRAGGFNLTSAGGGVIPIPPSYKPDVIWTYEVGTKHQLFDNKLVVDASLYRSDWSKVQSYNFAPGNVITIVTNAGDVSGWGVDLSATGRPTDSLTLTATYGWNNLEFDSATGDKRPGDPVDAAVRTSYSASIDFHPQLTAAVSGLFRIDYQHADKGQITLRNLGQVVPRPARDLVNVRLGATIGGNFDVALFVNNLFDEDAPNIVGPFGAVLENVEQRPRVIGVGASAKF